MEPLAEGLSRLGGSASVHDFFSFVVGVVIAVHQILLELLERVLWQNGYSNLFYNYVSCVTERCGTIPAKRGRT